MYLLALVSALSASTFTLGKALLSYAPPIFTIGVRMTLAGLLFYAYYWLKYRRTIIIKNKTDLFLFIQTALISFCASFVFEFWALQFLTSSKTAFLYNLSPFISAFFSYIHFQEEMTIKKFIGLTIGLLGFIPILMATSRAEGATFLYISWPEAAMFIAVVCYTYGWVLIRKLIKKRHYEALEVNTVGMIGGGLTALIVSILFERPQWYLVEPRSISWLPICHIPSFIALIIPLVIVGTMICYSMYGYFLKRYTATFVTFADFSSPLFAALYGWLFLKESVTWHFILSTIIVFVGVYLFYQEELRQGYFESL